MKLEYGKENILNCLECAIRTTEEVNDNDKNAK